MERLKAVSIPAIHKVLKQAAPQQKDWKEATCAEEKVHPQREKPNKSTDDNRQGCFQGTKECWTHVTPASDKFQFVFLPYLNTV